MSELTQRRTAMKAIALQGDNEYSDELAIWVDAASERIEALERLLARVWDINRGDNPYRTYRERVNDTITVIREKP